MPPNALPLLPLVLSATVTGGAGLAGGTQTATVGTAAPGAATPYRVEPDDSVSPGRRVLQGVLFVPRVASNVVLWPLGQVIYVLEKNDVPEFLVDLFYNDSRTFGVYPTAFVETGFGLNVGARAELRNVFDDNAHLGARAGYGGRFRQSYGADLDTGTLLGRHFAFVAEGAYEDLPNERFFGLGPTPGEDLIRIQRRRSLGRAGFVVRPTDRLAFTASGVYARSDVRNSVDNPGADLAAFRPQVDLFYEELRFTYDSRRPAELVPAATPSEGLYLSGTFGATQVTSDAPTQYYRYSADAQYLIDVAYGTRVLVLRVYSEGVFGAEDVPTVDLPRLGGPELLRGYRRDRFRDQNVVLGSIEYRYPLSAHFDAFLFVDGGRVFPRWSELDVDFWGLGFGGGLQVHGMDSVVARIQAGGSKDGDVVFNFVLSPDFERPPRSER